jgi:hypothetical protein
MTGIREWVDAHPKTIMSIVTVCVLSAICLTIIEIRSTRHTFPSGPPQYYFTVDDGLTYFAASSDNYPPFEYNGQEAVGAYVYECNGKRFVGYLERYTPAARTLMVAGTATPATMRFGRELKRPGDKAWVKSGDLATETRITDVPSPDGQGTPMLVMP